MKRFVLSRSSFAAAAVLGLALLSGLGACAASAQAPMAPVAPPPGMVATAPSAGDRNEGYILGIGDKVRLTVFGEGNLSGEFAVDSTGKVALPLVGDIQAEGLSLRQFEQAVVELLKQGYLNDPRVAAEVMNFRPFYILGEVARPGTYPYTSGLTVYNAVATAGGFTYRANQGSVKIKREGQEKEQDVKLTPSLTLEPGDTIRIKERWY